jgi:hypothetical protein
MNRRNLLLSTLFGSFLLIFLYACQKNEAAANGKARMQVSLTDDPGAYEAVFIDVQDVRINHTTDTASGWISLANVRRGSYNLLDLVNDKDTLLADAEIDPGTVQQLRLVLGPENYVRTQGRMIRLETPSAQQSGLKLNIHQDVTEGILYQVLLDFDVAKSIVQTGNGKYMLKPTIRTILKAAGGSIKGYVVPADFQTAVLAIQGSDTIASTYTNGGFLLRGLPAGSYQLSFLPTDTTYKTQTKSAVVTTSQLTVMDTVRLVK